MEMLEQIRPVLLFLLSPLCLLVRLIQEGGILLFEDGEPVVGTLIKHAGHSSHVQHRMLALLGHGDVLQMMLPVHHEKISHYLGNGENYLPASVAHHPGSHRMARELVAPNLQSWHESFERPRLDRSQCIR